MMDNSQANEDKFFEDEPFREETSEEHLPAGVDALLSRLKNIFSLQRVQEVSVDPTSITVRRMVRPGEDVAPQEMPQDLVLLPLLGKLVGTDSLIDLADPSVHPYIALLKAFELITHNGVRPRYVLSRPDGWLEAFLGLPEGATIETLFGVPVIFSRDSELDSRLLILGGLYDGIGNVTVGVAVDMGITE